MGANKTKLNKNILKQLVIRTDRSPAEIKAMYAIFRQHFPSGKIESPQDLYRCLQKFSLTPIEYSDQNALERLYRLFGGREPNPRLDNGIDFFHFMAVSDILERGSAGQKISLFFYSFDVNGDGLVTADDLEACLPSTVESRQLVQELMRQWDKTDDGVVSLDDFQKYIMTNPDLLPVFASRMERVRMNSVNLDSSTDNLRTANVYNINRGTFSTYQ